MADEFEPWIEHKAGHFPWKLGEVWQSWFRFEGEVAVVTFPITEDLLVRLPRDDMNYRILRKHSPDTLWKYRRKRPRALREIMDRAASIKTPETVSA